MHRTCLVHSLTFVSPWGKTKTDENTLQAAVEQPVKNICFFVCVSSETLVMTKKVR